MNFLEEIKKEKYDFLREDKHLGDNIVLLSLGGSYAYGMNNEQSDLDVRGIATNSKREIILGEDFEQIVHNDDEVDTTIYSVKKMFKLLTSANPNTVEILGCKPEHYLYISDIGQMILDNKNIFLSQVAINSFKGYAMQQLNRLEAALARDRNDATMKEEHIMSSCMRAMMSFGERYTAFPDGSMKLYIDKARDPDLDTEIFVDANLTGYPLRDFNNITSDMTNIIKDYSKLQKRNHKKDDNHLNKHAAHLVRLQLMAYDLIANGEIVTFRDHDPLLMEIRNGVFQKDDHTFKKEFFDIVAYNNKKIELAIENTKLPKLPNYEAIENLLYKINSEVIAK